MAEVGIYEAKTNLPKLVQRAERGEEITITRHGRPVAKIVPAAKPKPDIDETMAAIKKYRAGINLKGTTIRELIDEGRRF